MGIGIVHLRRCEIDKRGRLMCPDNRGYKNAFSNFDLNNNVFVVGGYSYKLEELSKNFDNDVIAEMVSYVKASLATFEVKV